MNLFKTLFILLCCLSATVLSAQKQQIKKANGYYKLNQYKDAITLYEEALQIKENLGASTKLAYCYRMTNQMIKAEDWYSKVVAFEKAKPITYFYYAESLMSNGKYDLAKNWFLKYNEKKPEDKNAIRMAYACDKVKTLEPYFKNVDLQEFQQNSNVDESSPLYFNDGIVFTSDRSTGVNPLKQKSGWTGRDFQRIYYSALESDGSYGNPSNFSKKLNDLNKHCGPVSFTKDKKTVIFTRTGQTLGKNNSYNIQLYSAESEDGKKWKNIELLPFCNKENNYMHPAISPDGSKLFFVSNKPGGLGGTDIYMSKKKGSSWGKPQNLGPIINTPANEAFPFFHASEKLFFCSKGHLSFGGFDILFSNEKEDGSWQKPVNVGKPINSSYDDISLFLDESMDTGLFASSRDGGDDDIYIFKVMEGINAELESLDFEDIAVEETEMPVETVSVDSPVSNQEAATSIPNSDNPVIEEVIEKNPVKNLEGSIRNDETLEKIREKPAAETVATPIPPKVETIKEEADIPKETMPSLEEAMPKDEEQQTSNSTLTPPNHEAVIPDQMVEIMDAPPMEEEIIEVEEDIVAIEPAVEATKTETPKIEKNKTPKKNSKIEESKSSKSVNLIIPSKKKKRINQPKKEKEIEVTTIDKEELIAEPVSVPQETVEPDEEIITKTVTPKIEKNKSIEKLIIPSKETSSPQSSILDREPMENAPPVLLGGESSMLMDKVEALPKLAELLQANQAIPAQGFEVLGLNYPTGSYLLSPEGTRSLSAVIDLMNAYPDLRIEIGSHTSSLGDDVNNHNLSRKRAMSIMAFLVYKGIANDRITAKGYGETQLINKCLNGVNCPRVDHEENDRIEVKVTQ